jgi:hypothetical protein
MYLSKLVKGMFQAAVMLSATSAMAAPAISTWDWRLTSGFTAWQDTLWYTGISQTDRAFINAQPGAGYQVRDSNGNLITAYNSLEWGRGTVQMTIPSGGIVPANCRLKQGSTTEAICQGNDPGTSRFSINSPTAAPPFITAAGTGGNVTLNVYGAYTEIGRFSFADNPVLSSSAFLDKTTYTANLAFGPQGGLLQDIARSIEIDFFETNNPGDLFGSTIRCAAGTGSGASGTDVGAGCGDIFVVRNFTSDTLVQRIIQDGFEYEFQSNFFVLDGSGSEIAAGTLSSEACALAGQASGCYGFVTREGIASNISLRTRVLVRAAAVQAPEPAALGLMGLGLLGLGVARRRKA